jgi:hypothetical protein
MFYPNRNTYLIGSFYEGVASGLGLYIWPNNSYYLGLFSNNKANDLKC